MDQIKKCSLAGISFTLEADAYAALEGYIQSLQEAYKNTPDGEEIVADIEARIAELILSAVPADAIVTKPLILNIIKQLGSAEEIDSEQPDHEEPRQAETTDQSGNPRIPRRLYRDVQHHKLGGVCAGIANYFDIDPTLVRLAAIAPILIWLFGEMNLFLLHYIEGLMGQLTGLVVLGYIVMWFTIPPASTARQKLEMKGERITTDSIRENVQSATAEERSRTLLADIVNIFGKILLICLKVLAAILMVGLVVGVCVLTMVAIAGFPMLTFDAVTGISLLAFYFVAVIPLLILIYLVIMLLISQRPKGRALLVMFILWVISLVGMTLSAIKSPARFENSIENLFESVFEHDEEILYKEFTQEEIDQWRSQQANSEPAIINSDSMMLLFEDSDFEELEDISILEEDAEVIIPVAGVTKNVDTKFGDQTTSCNVNGSHIIIFTGDKNDVEQCKKSVKFEPTRICFSTRKSNYSIEHNGRAYNGGKRIKDVTVEVIANDTKTFTFEVDGVKVKYFNWANVDIEDLTAPALDEIFSAVGYTINAVEQILELVNNSFNSSGDIEQARKDIQQAREEIEQEREKIREELQNLKLN
ncbi:MAG: PspC domain-containing protein [Alistipes sp.]|nr:PspC domain-containing protein [Alistipes sp.]